jgi:hypothetical protein
MTGGNNITVVGECQGKLHAAWDSCLVVKAAGADVAAAATDLMKSITPAKIEEWTHSDPVVWANESFAIAERAQTKYCVQRGLPRLLVLPLPLIRDRPQKAALCPGQVRYFHDHFRPHPMHF